MKKDFITLLIATSVITLTTANADSTQPTLCPMPTQYSALCSGVTSNNPPTPNNVNTIPGLETYLGNMYIANLTNEIYQIDPTIPSIQAANMASVIAPATVRKNAHTETSDSLGDNLLQFPYAYLGKPGLSLDGSNQNALKTASGKEFFAQYYKNTSDAALAAIPADDSLSYSSSTPSPADLNGTPSSQPALNNDYFNFANLIAPTAYSASQENAAKQFIVYAAQSTKNFAHDIPFSELKGNKTYLDKLKNSSAYQKFVVTMRSLLAIRSVTINSLNQLIAERTPLKNLGQSAGLPSNTTGYPDASPLQVEAYQANHRISDPNWYTRVENSSPATVQRNILIVLAEIEHQNYEAHLDSERLLATVAAGNLQNNLTSTQNLMLQQNMAVTKAICGLLPASAQAQCEKSMTPSS